MLWTKAWLETRWRFLLGLALVAITVGMSYRMGPVSPSHAAGMMALRPLQWFYTALIVAGAGIKTQASLQRTKGLHGSTYFTLSLPVSRLRLLATRTTIGLFETVAVLLIACAAPWILIPAVHAIYTADDVMKLALTMSCCAVAVHAVAVLMSTFLDQMWQTMASVGAILAAKELSTRFPPPRSFDVFQVFGEASPLLTHAIPWPALGVSIGCAAILFLIAAKVVNEQEY